MCVCEREKKTEREREVDYSCDGGRDGDGLPWEERRHISSANTEGRRTPCRCPQLRRGGKMNESSSETFNGCCLLGSEGHGGKDEN